MSQALAPHQIGVLVVDDSPTMRKLIRNGIEQDPRLKVIAEASNAIEARDAVKTFAPDAMTLDIEMPGMDGLEFLRRLMEARPMPVIMMSSLTSEGSEAALAALSLGALDCVEKPKFGAARETFSRLADLLVAVARQPHRGRKQETSSSVHVTDFEWNGKVLLIGASTGGVEALETVLAAFPSNAPPTLITQHMPQQFLQSFALRLDAQCAPSVRIAADTEVLKQGEVLIAPGGDYHLCLDPRNASVARNVAGPKTSGHRPSVDVMFDSALPFAANIVAALLTGMGRDGASAMKRLHDAGATCVIQGEDSSVVYGMPRVAKELSAYDVECELDQFGATLLSLSAKANEDKLGRSICPI